MPMVYVSISARLMQQAQSILDAGDYTSLNELLNVALENQLSIEMDSLQTPESPDPKGTLGASRDELPPLAHPGDLAVRVLATEPSEAQLLFPGIKAERDLYLWGQINRLLPVKIAARTLLGMTSNSDVVPLDVFRREAADVARATGLWIKVREDASAVSREDSHWVGLPVGAEAEKSIRRYQQHFLAYLRGDGVFEGALFRLKLAGLLDDGRTLALTEFGAHWAGLANPVLDSGSLVDLSFSRFESEDYLQHVLQRVPEERVPLEETVRLVAGGAFLTADIDAGLADAHPSWGSNTVVTMRAGNLGRMGELGIVSRSGRRGSAAYSLTDDGHRFLEACNTNPILG
jgi:hypothetical protein